MPECKECGYDGDWHLSHHRDCPNRRYRAIPARTIDDQTLDVVTLAEVMEALGFVVVTFE